MRGKSTHAAVTPPGETTDRKSDHLRLALDEAMQSPRGAFQAWGFEHCALPQLDYQAIDLSAEFLGYRLAMPLLISCMTGGTQEAAPINRNLARAAEAAGVALGVGSQRVALEDADAASSFQVRELAPSVPLLANLGAVQLNYGYGLDECRRAVEMIQADALVLHLNPLQEAIQPEGQRDFSGLAERIGEVVRELEVPVVVKEIGSGLSSSVASRLHEEGVRMLDTAGSGGTSWARIEGRRAESAQLGELFSDWGIPTPESILQLADLPDITLIASGGIRNGIEVAKALAMRAHLVGVAQPFLEAAHDSTEAVERRLARLGKELRTAMFCVGAADIERLRHTPLHSTGR